MSVAASSAGLTTGAEPEAAGPSTDEWTKTHSDAAEKDFAVWKAEKRIPDTFVENAVSGERADLVERTFSGDRLTETEMHPGEAVIEVAMTVRATVPRASAMKPDDSDHPTVWRRITRDRFEIWTPRTGRLFDAHGKQLAEVTVRRGDGHGREWYGAFLPDGRWVTTDLDDMDRLLTMYSAAGKKQWAIKGATLVPEEGSDYSSSPLIAWGRSDQAGRAWIVWVGSEFGRGIVKVTPDGKWSKVECPWKECFPQQLGPRGMYTGKYLTGDDGKNQITRSEAGHGMYVGWPTYRIGEGGIMIPAGENFGVLPGAWAVFVNASGSYDPVKPPAERESERLWMFDAGGTLQHWIAGASVGSSPASGALWVRLKDDTCVKVDKGYRLSGRSRFEVQGRRPLTPVELHEDIGLGLFLQEDNLVLCSWKVGK